jgi:DNA-binding transcriptional regulator YhcF (GntR family)
VRLRIERSGPGSVSSRLGEALVTRIVSGRLGPGSRLPTVRGLAAELGLAPNTVAKAYRRLEAEGYLEARGRHGTFVAEVLPAPPDDVDRALEAAARAYSARARQLGVPPSRALAAARRELTPRPRQQPPAAR